MKKGISLIVLVITIIVIIILAGTVILSLAQNNPIGQANEATRASDAGEIESALSMYLGTIMGQYRDQVKLGPTSTTFPANLASDTLVVVNNSGTPLFRNSVNKVEAYADLAAATAVDNTYKQLTVKAADLGLTSWPVYAGYELQVTNTADVTYKKL